MITAIIYYSMSENTAFIAEKIAEKLEHADLIRIEPVKAYPAKGAKKFFWGGKAAVMGDKPNLKAYEFNAEKYDCIVIGTPVWAGTFTPPVRSFIDQNKDALSGKRIAAFTSSSGGPDQSEKTLDKLKKYIGVDAFAAEFGLTDPKKKPNVKNEEIIDSFCEKIKA